MGKLATFRERHKFHPTLLPITYIVRYVMASLQGTLGDRNNGIVAGTKIEERGRDERERGRDPPLVLLAFLPGCRWVLGT